MSTLLNNPPLFGIAAEFDTPEALESAAHAVAEAGFRRVEAYSPFAIEGLAEILGMRRNPIPLIALIAGMLGALTGFGMCYYAFVIYYPLNIGGRPYNSWPAWIPITFEITVLFAALAAAIGMLVLNDLPRLYHPMFNLPHFERASTDRFFLCIEATDPLFNAAQVQILLGAQHPLSIAEVPA